jgi:RNA polymerase sigma factor (TIGR02999 family)
MPRDAVDNASLSKERLIALIYHELHGQAAAFLARERSDHTLQPTALVHEAYLRLANQEGLRPNDRTHFLAIAVQTMRRVLVDHARKRTAEKRGGAQRALPLDTALLGVSDSDAPGADVLSVEQALQNLEKINALTVRVVEMRFFGGLSIKETAEAMSMSESSVEREWRFARAWLRDALAGPD